MEKAAYQSVEDCMPEGFTTVGISVQVRHLAATPSGVAIMAKAELVEIDGKKLVFTVEAFDAIEKIGEGTHERYIINKEKFMQKTKEKTVK